MRSEALILQKLIHLNSPCDLILSLIAATPVEYAFEDQILNYMD